MINVALGHLYACATDKPLWQAFGGRVRESIRTNNTFAEPPSARSCFTRALHEHRPDFLRLANALSALYPRGSEEKRLLDAMLLAVPR